MFLVCFLSPGLVVLWNCPKELQCIVNKVIWEKKRTKATNSPSRLEEERYVYFEGATEITTLSLQRSALYPHFLLAQLSQITAETAVKI